MKQTIESQIENEMNQILIDIDILKVIIQNLYCDIHGFKEVYDSEIENFTILLNRLIRVLSAKCSKINQKMYNYMYKKKNLWNINFLFIFSRNLKINVIKNIVGKINKEMEIKLWQRQ